MASHVPRQRLVRPKALGGERTRSAEPSSAIATFGDVVTTGLEAARQVLELDSDIDTLMFATSTPLRTQKRRAIELHVALGLPSSVRATDVEGANRAGAHALRLALDSAAAGQRSLIVLSDFRPCVSGAEDEAEAQPGAAALLCSDEDECIVEYLGGGCATADTLERRSILASALETTSDESYLRGVELAVADVLTDCGLTLKDAHSIVTGLTRDGSRRVAARLNRDRHSPDLSSALGDVGCALDGVLLHRALRRAEPADVILIVSLADGLELLAFRATPVLTLFQNNHLALGEP